MDNDNGKYLEDIYLILLLLVLAVVCLPLLCGIAVAFLFNLNGSAFYTVIIFISTFLWCLLYILWWF